MEKEVGDKNVNFLLFEGLSDSLKQQLIESDIEELDIEDVFTNTQLSKLEFRKNYLYLGLQFPEFDKSKRVFGVKEIHVFVSDNKFVLIDKDRFRKVYPFTKLSEVRDYSSRGGYNIFYEMVDFFITEHFKALTKFKLEIEEVENQIFHFSEKEDMIREVLVIKRNLVNFQNIMIPLKDVLIDLQNKYFPLIGKEGVEKLDDTLDKIKKILNNLSNFKERMQLLTETNESLISRATNKQINRLTSISVIVLIPNIITSFFGMNVYFGWDPSVHGPWQLVIIFISMIASTAVAILYFRSKKWI
jgi:magnesium transporter